MLNRHFTFQQHAQKLITRLKDYQEKNRIQIEWFTQVNFMVGLDDELLEALASASCKQLFMGFESLDTESLKKMNKGMNNPEKYKESIRNVRKHGMEVVFSTILGGEHDTKEVGNQIAEFIEENDVFFVLPNILTPYPGTQLYRQMEKDRAIATYDTDLYNIRNVVFHHKTMSSDELQESYAKLCDRIFDFDKMVDRGLKAFPVTRFSHVIFWPERLAIVLLFIATAALMAFAGRLKWSIVGKIIRRMPQVFITRGTVLSLWCLFAVAADYDDFGKKEMLRYRNLKHQPSVSRRFQLNWSRLSTSFFALIIVLAGCKSINNSSKVFDEGERKPKDDIGPAVADFGKMPLQTLTEMLNPTSTGVRAIQLLLANDSRMTEAAAAWAKNELKTLQTKFKSQEPLWDLLRTLAGPDQLINYGDVKNTLACTSDSEIKSTIGSLLARESAKKSGYVKVAYDKLLHLIANNKKLPAYSESWNVNDLFSAEGREQLALGYIDRALNNVFIDQCKIPKDQLQASGVFDQIKTFCYQALEWRYQGLLAGLLNLHYAQESKDHAGECSGRSLSAAKILRVIDQYGGATASSKSPGSLEVSMTALVRLQASRYFGSFDRPNAPEVGTIQTASVKTFLPEVIAQYDLSLRGGVPINAVVNALADLADGKFEQMTVTLEKLRKSFSIDPNCSALETKYFGKIKSKLNQDFGLESYRSENHLRAIFDIDFAGEDWIKGNLEEKSAALGERSFNAVNSKLIKRSTTSGAQFYFAGLGSLNFLGTSAYLNSAAFVQQPSGRITTSHIVVEQEIDGQFLVTEVRTNGSKSSETEFEGYAIPVEKHAANGVCIGFRGTAK